MPHFDGRGGGDLGQRPRVSVIIPTHNRAELLLRAIRSVVEQHVPNTQIVVIDDGSTDDTTERVAALTNSTAGLLYVRQSNAGVVSARNHGLRLASGAYIAFLDSDDEWLPNKLRMQLAVLDARPDIGMCWTDMAKVDPHGDVVNERHLRSMYSAYRRVDEAQLFTEAIPIESLDDCPLDLGGVIVRVGTLFPAIVRGNLVHTSTVLIRSTVARQVGGFDPALNPSGEDHDFHLRTARLTTVALIDHPLVRYRVGADDQLTRPELELTIAEHFLMTVDKAVAAGRTGCVPVVPNADARVARAEAHRWLAYLQLESGHRRRAVAHAVRGIAFAPTGRRQWQMMGRVLLPRRLETVLRSRALRQKRSQATTPRA